MGIDLEQIRRNYREFEDFQIEQLAKHEAGALEPGVVSILQDEIKRRGLDANLNKGIEAQTTPLSDSELQELKSRIVGLPCPECGQRNTPLIGVLLREVKSFVVLTVSRKAPLILCRSCAHKRLRRAMLITATLGWWGLPWGFFRTLHAISCFGENEDDRHSDAILNAFVVQNIGELRTNFQNDAVLSALLRLRNSLE